MQVLQKAWNFLSDDVKAILQIAESNLNALNTVHLGHKRPFSVGECALWARLTGPRFAGQLAKSSQVNTLPKAKSETRSKQNRDMHKCSSVYSEQGVPLPVMTSGGE